MSLLSVVKAEPDKLSKRQVIRKVIRPAPWSSCLVVVENASASGDYRLFVDTVRVNKVVPRERHALPTAGQVLGLLGDPKLFSKLDVTSSLHHVRLAKSSQELTMFNTPIGRYCLGQLPFRMAAPGYFQRQMSYILEGQKGVVKITDDVLVFRRDQEEHEKRLAEVFARMKKAGLIFNKANASSG